LKNGPLFYSDNNIIIFSHQFLQTAQAVLVFLLLHTDAALLSWACALGMQRIRSCKVIINKAFYRQARQAVWFDSG